MELILENRAHTVASSPAPLAGADPARVLGGHPAERLVATAPKLTLTLTADGLCDGAALVGLRADRLDWTWTPADGAPPVSDALDLLRPRTEQAYYLGGWMRLTEAWLDLPLSLEGGALTLELRTYYDRRADAAGWSGGPAGTFVTAQGNTYPLPLSDPFDGPDPLRAGAQLRFAKHAATVRHWSVVAGRARLILDAPPELGWSVGDPVHVDGLDPALFETPHPVADIPAPTVVELDAPELADRPGVDAAATAALAVGVAAVTGNGTAPNSVTLHPDPGWDPGPLLAAHNPPAVGVAWVGRVHRLPGMRVGDSQQVGGAWSISGAETATSVRALEDVYKATRVVGAERHRPMMARLLNKKRNKRIVYGRFAADSMTSTLQARHADWDQVGYQIQPID